MSAKKKKIVNQPVNASSVRRFGSLLSTSNCVQFLWQKTRALRAEKDTHCLLRVVPPLFSHSFAPSPPIVRSRLVRCARVSFLISGSPPDRRRMNRSSEQTEVSVFVSAETLWILEANSLSPRFLLLPSLAKRKMFGSRWRLVHTLAGKHLGVRNSNWPGWWNVSFSPLFLFFFSPGCAS